MKMTIHTRYFLKTILKVKKSWAWVYTFNASAWEAEGGVRVQVYSLVYTTQTPSNYLKTKSETKNNKKQQQKSKKNKEQNSFN